MNDPVINCAMEEYSDAQRLKDIRAIWLADLPLKVAFVMIGRAAFDEKALKFVDDKTPGHRSHKDEDSDV